jgi:hypothetical protein
MCMGLLTLSHAILYRTTSPPPHPFTATVPLMNGNDGDDVMDGGVCHIISLLDASALAL